MQRDELARYLKDYLDTEVFNDLGPNGLQVQGRPEIEKIVCAVSAGMELFEKALLLKADAVMVHHGVIWNFERPLYKGSYKKRIKLLLENDLNLYAYHLPLDAHPEVGNNIVISHTLGLTNAWPFGDYKGRFVGYRAEAGGIAAQTFFEKIRKEINEQALIFPYGPDKIEQVGIISGGAQKDVTQAVEAGLDLYLTGEVSEHILNYVKEEGIHFVSAGHYATERFGIKALGRHLEEKFGLQVQFVDIPNPV